MNSLYFESEVPYYASPQLFKFKPYNQKSDIWSLGCVIYQICTLNKPFIAQSINGLGLKIIQGKYKKIRAQYSQELSQMIKSMLQVNPVKRPKTNQLLEILLRKAQQFNIGIDFESEKLQFVKEKGYKKENNQFSKNINKKQITQIRYTQN